MKAWRALVVVLLTVAVWAAFTGRGDAQAPTEPPDTTPTTTAPTPDPPPPAVADQSVAADIGNVLFPDGIGRYPTDRYKLYYGNGDLKISAPNLPGPIDDIAKAVTGIDPSVQTPVPTERSMNGTFLGWMVDGLRLAASIVWQLTVWLFSFGFLRILGPLADSISSVIDVTIVGGLRLRELVGLVVGFGLAWRLIRFHRFANVFAELCTAVVLLAASWMLIAHPAGYFNAIANFGSQAAQLPFRAINPDNPDGGRDAAAAGMKRAFVEAPWQVINWGHEPTGACAAASDRVLAEGPFDTTDSKPRKIMMDADCQAEAKFNNEPSGARLAMVFAILAAALAALFFVAACVWAFLRSMIGLFWSAATGGIRLLLGSMQVTRQLAFGLVKDVADDLITMIVPAWLLAFMVMGDLALLALGDAVSATPAGAAVTTVGHQAQAVPVFLRLLLMAVFNWTLFAKRKAIVNRAARFMSAKIDRASARVVRADQADVKAARAAAAKTEARDFMPDHKLVTVPIVAGAVAAGRQMATGGQRVRQVRGAATAVAGPAGKAVAGTKAGAAMVADKSKEAAGDVRSAGQQASTSAVDLGRRVSAAASARGAAARQAADLRAGRGTAPLGDVHGPTRADFDAVRARHDDETMVDVLAPGSEAAPPAEPTETAAA